MTSDLKEDVFDEPYQPMRNGWEYNDVCALAVREVALEGLDGITIDGLWRRVGQALRQKLPFSERLEKLIWSTLTRLDSIRFYVLNAPRQKLSIRESGCNYDAAGNDTYPIEVSKSHLAIYPNHFVCDKEQGIMGSCETYTSRMDVTDAIRSVDLDHAVKNHGNALVIVANQALRNNVLLPYTSVFLMNLSDPQYCILERVGRSRNIGEMTSSAFALMEICKDSKTLFYYIKMLQEQQLIVKQHFVFYNPLTNLNVTCNLIHLHHFHAPRRTRRQAFIEQFIKMLKMRPHYRMEYAELRKMIGSTNWEKYAIAKIIKSNELKQYIRTDLYLLYREVYPNATVSEWKRKISNQEKLVRVFELLNPNINLNSLWKEDDPKDSSSDEDEEQISDVPYNAPIISTLYDIIVKSGSDGILLRDLQRLTGMDFYTVRAATKLLKKRELIESVNVDFGRQRFTKYRTLCNENTTNLTQDAMRSNDAIDFVANVLNIERKYLEHQRVEKVIEVKQQGGLYQEIRDTRISLGKLNREEGTDELKAEKKMRLKEIYSNAHHYQQGELLPAAKIMNINESFKKITCSLFNNAPKLEHTTMFYDKMRPNEAQIDRECEKRFVSKMQQPSRPKNVNMKKILLQLVGNAPAAILLKSNKYYMQRVRMVVQKLRENAQSERAELTKSLISSSDDESVNEDAKSMDLNLDDGEIKRRDENETEENDRSVRIESYVGRKRKHSVCDDDDDDHDAVEEKHVKKSKSMSHYIYGTFMELYMGPKPKLIRHEVNAEGVDIKVLVSSDPRDFAGIKVTSLSERVVSRTDFVRDCIKKHKFITDFAKMREYVTAAERKEGYLMSIDRKSLHRIYRSLIISGDLKIVKIIGNYNDNIIRKKSMLLCPDVDIQGLVDSVIDQFVMSFSIYAKRKTVVKREEDTKMTEVKEELETASPNSSEKQKLTLEVRTNIKYKYSSVIGKIYGYLPKFTKMRALHEFLFYLLYDYSGSEIPDDQVYDILSQHTDKVDELMLNEVTTLYKPELSWRMFIPPLPEHRNWPNGWLLIGDALLRLPISIFVKLFNITYVIPEFQKKYLDHPIRKHFLVKQLTPDIRDAVLGYRKYIFAIHEVFCYLCYMGIVQFGPQKYREKDQLFIYLNRNGLLLNTSTSEAGYHQVTAKEYPEIRYNLTTKCDVEKYWCDLFMLSGHSKLGFRNCVIGKLIKLQHAHTKDDLMETLKAQTHESAVKRDIGYLPGDHLGACGVDSALWVHVRRNWFWQDNATGNSNLSKAARPSGLRKKVMDNVKQMKLFTAENMKQKTYKHSHKSVAADASTSKKTTSKKGSKKKVVIRKVKRYQYGKVKRVRVDEIDKNIQKKMGNSRANFSKEEDEVLLMCHAVIQYLCPNSRKRTVVVTTIRDFIHRILPYSRKTAASYKRRIFWLNKSKNIEDKRPMYSKLSSDYFTQKYFKRIRDKILDTGHSINDLQVSLTFLYLAYFTYKRFEHTFGNEDRNEQENFKDFLIPELLDKYKIPNDDDGGVYANVKVETDIHLDTIKSIIHSSLCSKNMSSEWCFKLVQHYQAFSETMLRSALLSLREQQVVSSMKSSNKLAMNCKAQAFSTGSISYHLSFAYTFNQITKYPSYIFNEAYAFFNAAYANIEAISSEGKSIEKFEQGHGLALSEMGTQQQFVFIFDLPKDVITLDTDIKDYKELVKELAIRYQYLMRKTDDENEVRDKEQKQDVQHLEKVFENYFKSQITGDQTVTIGDSENEMPINFPAFKDSEDLTISTDRRSKGLRVSDMAFLLTKGLLPEMDDDERLERLNRHFIVKYPTCKFRIEDENFHRNDLVYEECHNRVIEKSKYALERFKSDYLVGNTLPSPDEINSQLELHGANDEDKLLAQQILSHIHSRDIFGANGTEIKDHFIENTIDDLESMNLNDILTLLIKIRIIIRVGVTSVNFVHFNYRHNWTIYVGLDEDSQSKSIGHRVRLSPWVNINGTLHDDVFNKWLGIILSHCLSYPFITFTDLCKRFYNIKPIDIYFLLEFLNEITCIKLMVHRNVVEVGIFEDDFDMDVEIGAADLLCELKHIFVETDHRAALKFGAYLSQHKQNSTFTFD